MKISVLVTGVSGSGKTTVCKALQNLEYKAIDIEAIGGLYDLVDEKSGEIVPGTRDDIKEGLDWNCNKAKLQNLVDTEPGELTFYCGGMSNTDEIWYVFDTVVVLTVSDDTTIHRLSARTTGEFGGKEQDRKWVLSWKHDIERDWLERGGIEVQAENSPPDVAKRVVEVANG